MLKTAATAVWQHQHRHEEHNEGHPRGATLRPSPPADAFCAGHLSVSECLLLVCLSLSVVVFRIFFLFCIPLDFKDQGYIKDI